MKSFRFNAIWLASLREKRARTVNFHARKNLIYGMNHTGKSTIIKNLFLTLGARPEGKLQEWDTTAASVVSFNVDKNAFLAVHQLGVRAMFNSKGELIASASSHNEWTDVFARTTGFNLVLTNKKMQTVLADAHCFFLPFYINQDGSWHSGWNTFAGIQQYRSPIGAILDYFSGVRPPEYYDLNSQKVQAQHLLSELEREEVFLNRARERFSKSMSLVGPKVYPENFSAEIDRLTKEVNELNSKQEKLREQAVRERELLSNIRLQINLADDTLNVYEKDSSFLRSEQPERLACPTCGSEHSRSFLEVLTYAEDARVLRELVVQLHGDAVVAARQCEKTTLKLKDLEENYKRVSHVLDVRRGELRFGDVVNSIGAENAFQAFEGEAAALKKEIDKQRDAIAALYVRLRELTDPERSKDISSAFRAAYVAALVSLNLPPIETEKLRLVSRPNISGSGGPRSILAYYAALWAVCLGMYGAYSIPLVIDAPQQQGQDQINFPKILSFIANNLPENVQVIAGIEMSTDEKFDQVTHLTEQYKLLRADDYEEISAIVEPLLEAMHRDVRRRASPEAV